MIAINDNQTLAQFKAREAPLPSPADIRPGEGVAYALLAAEDYSPKDGGKFALIRIGMTRIDPRVPAQFGAFPTAMIGHPMCPENRPAPASAVRYAPPKKVGRTLPSYLRLVS
ncbi:hypothetical protein [Klebsiella pneumoniae]|uniref:hypothetical protein n=1 Tax=Klebsiella pneumoniae TaxID=573 RepID=UPI00356A65C3